MVVAFASERLVHSLPRMRATQVSNRDRDVATGTVLPASLNSGEPALPDGQYERRGRGNRYTVERLRVDRKHFRRIRRKCYQMVNRRSACVRRNLNPGEKVGSKAPLNSAEPIPTGQDAAASAGGGAEAHAGDAISRERRRRESYSVG